MKKMKWRLANGYCKSLRCRRMELSPWDVGEKARLGCFGIHTRFHGFTAKTIRDAQRGPWPRVIRLIARKIERFMKSLRVLRPYIL